MFEIQVMSPRAAQLRHLMPVKQAADSSRFLLAPMPGLLVRISVHPGDVVKSGQELAVVEAMKMENSLRAARDGIVSTLLAAPNDSLAVDQPYSNSSDTQNGRRRGFDRSGPQR